MTETEAADTWQAPAWWDLWKAKLSITECVVFSVPKESRMEQFSSEINVHVSKESLGILQTSETSSI